MMVVPNVFFVAIAISYKGAPVEGHLKIELSATEPALFAGEPKTGAVMAVVNDQVADQSLLADGLFAFTLQ